MGPGAKEMLAKCCCLEIRLFVVSIVCPYNTHRLNDCYEHLKVIYTVVNFSLCVSKGGSPLPCVTQEAFDRAEFYLRFQNLAKVLATA